MSDESLVRHLEQQPSPKVNAGNAVADVLRRARALVDTPEKWCQGAYIHADGRMCIVGAVVEASETSGISATAAMAALGCGSWFNDRPGRTHPEILAAFDRAIALAEQPGGQGL